jgi:hypothetical protein
MFRLHNEIVEIGAIYDTEKLELAEARCPFHESPFWLQNYLGYNPTTASYNASVVKIFYTM